MPACRVAVERRADRYTVICNGPLWTAGRHDTRVALDDLAPAITPCDGIVGGIPPGNRADLERDRNRLGGMRASESKKLKSVTKSRSSALSCSALPVGSGWKPMMCDRRLSGIRLNRSSLLQRPQPVSSQKNIRLTTVASVCSSSAFKQYCPERLHVSHEISNI
jgi:hypothetical protein